MANACTDPALCNSTRKGSRQALRAERAQGFETDVRDSWTASPRTVLTAAMTQGRIATRELTARGWLIWIAGGCAALVIGVMTAAGWLMAGGALVATVAAFGLAWRLLANR
jgi:hypothetical protein